MTDDSTRETDGGVTATGYRSVAGERDVGEGDLRRQVLTVAANEYRLSVRNRWALALTALFGLLATVLVGFGGSNVGPTRVDAVLVSIASLATYLLPLAALVFGYDAVVGAEERGWLDVVFALPVSRARVVVGTYLGRAATLTAAISVGFGAGGGLLFVVAEGADPVLYATFLSAAVLLGLAFLAIGVLLSTVAAEKTHALGLALLVWVWFVFGHDLVALGLIAGLQLPDLALSAMVLSNPVDIFRVLVLSSIDSTGGGMAAIVTETSLSTPVLVVAALAWVVGPVAGAARLARRRSL